MTIRVGIKPYVYQGIAGWRVRWHDGKRQRSLFTEFRNDARDIRTRIKAGKGTGSRWAVSI